MSRSSHSLSVVRNYTPQRRKQTRKPEAFVWLNSPTICKYPAATFCPPTPRPAAHSRSHDAVKKLHTHPMNSRWLKKIGATAANCCSPSLSPRDVQHMEPHSVEWDTRAAQCGATKKVGGSVTTHGKHMDPFRPASLQIRRMTLNRGWCVFILFPAAALRLQKRFPGDYSLFAAWPYLEAASIGEAALQ